MKQNKKAKICFVIYIAGFFLKNNFCYEVIVKQKINKRSSIYYSCVCTCCDTLTSYSGFVKNQSSLFLRATASSTLSSFALLLLCLYSRRSPLSCSIFFLSLTFQSLFRGAAKAEHREQQKRDREYVQLESPPFPCVCFITAGPITKLCAWREEESGGHVL